MMVREKTLTFALASLALHVVIAISGASSFARTEYLLSFIGIFLISVLIYGYLELQEIQLGGDFLQAIFSFAVASLVQLAATSGGIEEIGFIVVATIVLQSSIFIYLSSIVVRKVLSQSDKEGK